MRVHFERTGGLAAPAMKKAITVDTANLPEHEANELLALVQSAALEQPTSRTKEPGPGRDMFRYKLSVDQEGAQHTVELPENQIPDQLRPLIDWLKKRAGPIVMR